MIKLKIPLSGYLLRRSLILFFFALTSIYAQSAAVITTHNDSTVIADSLTASYDSNKVRLSPPQLQPVENIGADISSDSTMTVINDDFDFEKFKSVGEFISYYFPASVNSFGMFGHPEFINFYDSDNLLFLTDNISQSDFGSVNPFNFSLTGVDRIELSPLSRAFLFSKNLNNTVANIITRDSFNTIPLTKILYLQGKNDEGEINVYFSKKFTKRISFLFNIANKSVSSYYKNSDYSHWSGFAKIKYLLNKKINLLISYSQIKSAVGLNGGVDIDSIKNGLHVSDLNSILYNNYLAPVVFPNRYLKVSGQNLTVSFISKFSQNESFTSRFYYFDNLKEFRSNEQSNASNRNTPRIINNTRVNKVGADFKNSFSTDIFHTDVFGNLEKLNVSSPLYINNINSINASLGGIFTLTNFSKILHPSIFANSVLYNGKTLLGFGSDITLAPNRNYSIRTGVSSYEKPFPLFVEEIGGISKTKVFTAELTGNVAINNSSIKLSAFYINKKNAPFAFSTEQQKQYLNPEKIDFGLTNKSTIGGNLFADINFFKFQLIVNATYRYSVTFNELQDLPFLSANAGLFYKDYMFSNNLYLKTGINVYFHGRENNLFYNFETGFPVRFYKSSFDKILTLPSDGSEKAFTVDFTLLGRIRKRATLFFIFENLTNKEYFVVPYYPKQSRGIRFGVEWNINN